MPLQFKNSEEQVFLGCLGGINYCLFLYCDNKEYIVTSDKEKCSLFFNFFSSVFIKEPELIEENILFQSKNCKINNITINEDMIIKKLNKIKID